MRCALGTNDILLNSQFASAQQDYINSAGNCLIGQFTSNGGRAKEEQLKFSCSPSPTYRQFCSDLKGSLCKVEGYMSNWLSFPVGALTANFTSEICLPSACYDLAYDKIISDLFNPLATSAFCANASLFPSSPCWTQIQCTAPPVLRTASGELQLNMEYNMGIVALLVFFAVILIAADLYFFFLRRRAA